MGLRGFTLIELAIVLVIIGLFVGSILVGRDLIANSALRGEVSQLVAFNAAFETFRLKYHCLAGDASEEQLGDSMADLAPGDFGNGNGALEIAPTTVGGLVYESVLAWKHLSKGGLIAGSYDGQLSATGCPPTTSCPGSRLGGQLSHYAFGMSSLFASPGLYGLPMTLSPTQLGISLWNGVIVGNATGNLTAEQVAGIDMKLDDGKPDRGRVLGISNVGGGLGTCVSADSSVTDGSVEYLLNSTTDDCVLIYGLQ